MASVTGVTEETVTLPSVPAPRIVKPRKPGANWRPVIALWRDQVRISKETVVSSHELPMLLRHHPPAILVCQDFGSHFERIIDTFRAEDTFTYRVTPFTRYHRDDHRFPILTDCICNYFGWRTLKPNGKTKSTHFHYPLDPIWFLSVGIEHFDDDPDRPKVDKLYQWGIQVRDWAMAQELKFSASAGGLAAQLLKDPRFYPEDRRKVPRRVNAQVRPHLPGNHYELFTTPKIPKNAIILDMENAHHALARRLRFPDANNLYAYGTVPGDGRKHWKELATDHSRTFPIRPGLYCLTVSIPHIAHSHFPPPTLRRSGLQRIVLYSNEIDWVRSFGVTIEGIWWAITSDQTESGLNRYAEFAIREIARNPTYKAWLKPTLHSVYGLLAARPREFETGFRGDGWDYPMGNFSVPVRRVKFGASKEANIVNVIHRGMIEAEVRKEALFYARLLTEADGHRILAVYADALIIEDTGKEIRLLEYPWRIKQHVRYLRFLNATQFVSPSISRLPGIPSTARERYIRQRELSDTLQAGRDARAEPPIWRP